MSLTAFEQQVILHSLKKLYSDNFFSICVVNEIADMLGKPIRGSRRYKALAAIHCIYWADMTPDFRKSVREEVEGILGIEYAPYREEKIVLGERVEEPTGPVFSTKNTIVKLAFWRR